VGEVERKEDLEKAKQIFKAIPNRDFMVKVDSYLSLLVHRHKSFLQTIEMYDEFVELSREARKYID